MAKGESFKDLFSRGEITVAKQRRVSVGEEVEGIVGHVGKDSVLIDLDDKQQPHWLALDPLSNRIIVANSNPQSEARLWMLKFDPVSGLLSYDYTFHDPVLQGAGHTHRLILVTAHRRESFGQPFHEMCRAMRDLAARNHDVEIIYPVHPNPNVQRVARELLGGQPRVHLIEPLDYLPFVHLMKKAYLVLTDSGGIQEEAPSLGKPVLVMREVEGLAYQEMADRMDCSIGTIMSRLFHARKKMQRLLQEYRTGDGA